MDGPTLRLTIKSAVDAAHRALNRYADAVRNEAPKGSGGACHYQPVAITLANFGWEVIGDRRTEVVTR